MVDVLAFERPKILFADISVFPQESAIPARLVPDVVVLVNARLLIVFFVTIAPLTLIEFMNIPIPASKVLDTPAFVLAQERFVMILLLITGVPVAIIPLNPPEVEVLVEFTDTFLIVLGKATVPIVPLLVTVEMPLKIP